LSITFAIVFSAQLIFPNDSQNPSDGEEAGTSSEPHGCKHSRLQFFLANHQGSDMKKRFDNRINMNVRDKY